MATQMLDAGVPVMVVAARLAHARASTILNVYAARDAGKRSERSRDAEGPNGVAIDRWIEGRHHLGEKMPSGWSLAVVAHATTGPNEMDIMDEVPNGTARERFIGIYLDVSCHLAKVRVAGSNPVVRSIQIAVQGT
jgi:hypothetical protein